MSRRTLLTSAVVLLGVSSVASAQDGEPRARSWSGSYGLDIAAMPRYTGSDEYRVRPTPLVQLEYKGRFFLGGSQASNGIAVGARVLRAGGLAMSMELSAEGGRRESWADALTGMGNQSAATFVGTTVSYTLGFISASAGVAKGLDADFGTRGAASLGASTVLGGRWVASLASGAVFADRTGMSREFGIDVVQAAKRQALIDAGDPRLSPEDAGTFSLDGGLEQTTLSASLGYSLTPRTTLMLFANGTHLSSEAARSPLVRRRDGGSVGMGMMVGF